jgi:hypothetical protein
MELNVVKKIGEDVGANAVRFVLKDYDEYKSNVGDILYNKSHVWKNGKKTDKVLGGLCFILLSKLDCVYYYDKIFYAYSEGYILGADSGEIIIKNPIVLHIIN